MSASDLGAERSYHVETAEQGPLPYQRPADRPNFLTPAPLTAYAAGPIVFLMKMKSITLTAELTERYMTDEKYRSSIVARANGLARAHKRCVVYAPGNRPLLTVTLAADGTLGRSGGTPGPFDPSPIATAARQNSERS